MPDPKKYDLDFRPDPDFSPSIDDRDPKPFDPAFFGGAFLPPLRWNEVEIARITLESTTFDVISIRARICKRRIYYSVVDEYEGQVSYECQRKSSVRPLTMRELIDLMENTEVNGEYTGLVLGMAQNGFECSGYADQWVHFANVSSDVYPQLAEWYFDAFEEWYEGNKDKDLSFERPESP